MTYGEAVQDVERGDLKMAEVIYKRLLLDGTHADVVRKGPHLYFVRVGGCVVETLRISVVAIKACDEVADEWNINHPHPFQS